MRVSEFAFKHVSDVNTCFHCGRGLSGSVALKFCFADCADHNGIGINYFIKEDWIYKLSARFYKNDLDISFDFEKKETEISFSGKEDKAIVPHIVDFDLTKITIEGVKDILAFI